MSISLVIDMPIYLSEADVANLVGIEDALKATRSAFRDWSKQGTENLARQRLPLPGGQHNLMAAASAGRDVFGHKAYFAVGGKGAYHVALYEISTGRFLALIEANLLSQLRTGAASGVATERLAAPGSRRLAVIGSGKQARAQALACLAVRPFDQVSVFSPTRDHRESFAAAIESESGVTAAPATSANECVAGADVVITITKAKEPVLSTEALTPHAHVNAAGANAQSRRELPDDLVRTASRVVTDDRRQARFEAAEFIRCADAEPGFWDRVEELGSIPEEPVSNASPGRTIFKSLGIALEDVAFADSIYRRAIEAGRGERFG